MCQIYITQTDLGALYGVSRVVIGRWLTEAGLGTSKAPTKLAIEKGYCAEGPRPQEWVPFWLWRLDAVAELFEAQGYEIVIDSEKANL